MTMVEQLRDKWPALLVAAASFFIGRWINFVDGKLVMVEQHETKIAVIHEIQRQQLDILERQNRLIENISRQR